jgi:hypothetical protein
LSKGLSVDIDAQSVFALASAFTATDEQVEAALRSTYAKMGRWLRTRAMRGLSSQLRIQQKILRARVKTFRLQGGIQDGGAGAKVWFGLRPISLMRLNARESGKGVRADGGRFVEGGFIARVGGRPQVLRRVGKERLPLEVVMADIADPSTVYIEDELVGSAEFDRQFFKFLEHELKWRTRILK